MIGVDISNAFNTLNCGCVLKALERYRLPGYLLVIVTKYLEERYIIYELRDGKTHRRAISRGVSQGSALGPLLWIVAYDGILRHHVPQGVRIFGYADDTCILVQGTTPIEISDRVLETIILLERKLERMGLRVAHEKTEFILLTHGLTGFERFVLSIFGNNIYPAQTIRYLGFELDPKWDFSRHLTIAAEKERRAANALTRILPNLIGPSENKRRLYVTVLHSTLMYGAPVWQPCLTKKKVEPMIKVQDIMAKRVIAAYCTVAGVAARLLAKIPPADLKAKRNWRVFHRTRDLWKTLGDGAEPVPKALQLIKQQAEMQMLQEWKEDLQKRGQPALRVRNWIIPYFEQWYARRWVDLAFGAPRS